MGPFQVREMYIYPLWLHMTYTCTTRYPAWPVCTTLSLFHKKRPLCWFYSLLNTLPPRGSFTCASVTCGLYFHLCSNIPLTPKPSFPTPQTQQPYFQPPLYVSFPSHLSEDHSLSCSTFVFKVFSVFFFFHHKYVNSVKVQTSTLSRFYLSPSPKQCLPYRTK